MSKTQASSAENIDLTNNTDETSTFDSHEKSRIAKSPGSSSRPASRNGVTETSGLSSVSYGVVEAMSNFLRWSPTHLKKASDGGGSGFSSEESANASDRNMDSPRRKMSSMSKVKSAPDFDPVEQSGTTEQTQGRHRTSDNGALEVKVTSTASHRHSNNQDIAEEQESFLFRNEDKQNTPCDVSWSKKSSSVTVSLVQDKDRQNVNQSERVEGKDNQTDKQKSGTVSSYVVVPNSAVLTSKLPDKASDSASSGDYRQVRTRERSFEKSLENILDKCSEKSGDITLGVESRNGGQSDVSKSFDESSLGGSSKKSDKKKRSSPWYTVLTPSYKSRSEDFKKQFKDVPTDERLVVDYSCALQKEILVQGRMYVTQNWVCFYANIFRWETVLTIPCKDITAITKEKTALVIPNAIQICTNKEKYFFTSLGNRDKTYMMLFRIWQNALLNQPMLAPELWQWIHWNYGDDLCLTSDDEDYLPPVEHAKCVVKKETDDSELVIPEEGEDLETLCVEAPFPEVMETTRSTTADLPTDQSDTTEDDEEEVAIPPEHKHYTRCYLDEVLSIPVDKLYELMFTRSDFYVRLHERAGRKELKYTEWQDDSATGHKYRNISYIIPLNYSIGPKSSQTEEKQILYSGTKAGSLYMLDAEVICMGIPYGDSFMVVNRYTLNRVTPFTSRLKISSEIRYRKSVWGMVKSMIQKNSFQGLLDYFNMVAAHLNQEAVKYESSGGQQHTKRKLRRKRSRAPHQTSFSGSVHVKHKLATRHLSLMEKPKKHQTEASVTQPSPSRAISTHKEETLTKLNADTLVRVILVVLVLLVLFNAVLFYKLWYLESYTNFLYFPRRGSSLEDIQNYPKTQEEWVQLLRQQQYLHENEIDKWKEVLASSISLIDQMRGTLVKLKTTLEHRMNGMSHHMYTSEYNSDPS